MSATASRPEQASAKSGQAIAFGLKLERERASARTLRPKRELPADRLPAAKPSTRQELWQRLERARGHLHRILDRVVSLEELAGIATLSPFHLARHFKLAFGVSPIAYHRILRLERAARLLSSGAVSVAEAAERTGYSDAVALTHAFRRHFGQSPRRWAMQPC
jgi:AraC-like DNA-binding protein